jgi:hypothetical protein
MVACIAVTSNLSNITLMPRTGPRPVVSAGLLMAAAGTAWLTRIGVHSSYAGTILGPIMVTGAGLGFMFSTAFNTGTYGVPPRDAGVASATVNAGQQLGGSIGAAILNTIAASATASYLATRTRGRPAPALVQASLVHGYTTAFWVTAGIFAAAAVLCGSLTRPGPLQPARMPGRGKVQARRQHPVQAPPPADRRHQPEGPRRLGPPQKRRPGPGGKNTPLIDWLDVSAEPVFGAASRPRTAERRRIRRADTR